MGDVIPFYSGLKFDRYILVNRQVRITDDLMEWYHFMEDVEARIVGNTTICEFPRVYVSTVFIGVPVLPPSPPLFIFETMVFGTDIKDGFDQYQTWDEAAAGHERIVAETRKQFTVYRRFKAFFRQLLLIFKRRYVVLTYREHAFLNNG